MQIFNDVAIFAARPKFLNGFDLTVTTLPNTVTPSIGGNGVAIGSGQVVTITNLLGAGNGDSIKILGDGTTTLKNGTNIFTNTGADKLLALNKVYTLTYINKLWYEDA